MPHKIDKDKILNIANVVLDSVCECSNLNIQDIKGNSRKQEYVIARAVYFSCVQHMIIRYVDRKHRFNNNAEVKLLSALVNRNYSSLIHHKKHHDSNMKTYPAYADLYNRVFKDAAPKAEQIIHPMYYIDSIPQL